ncbi:MAG TPA: hypothetical protein VHT05_10150 [Candidatus Elarobacter sp.]|nr:hypothetical protein [Candidatus Elarobacter sp.]
MERMPSGRSDTLAEWKSDLFALPDAKIREYLRDVEHFTPEQIEAFCARGAAIVPQDWETTDQAHAAMERLMAFTGRVEPEGGPGTVDARGARGAALDADDDSAAAVGDDDAPRRRDRVEPPDEATDGVADAASDYGGAALPPP